jgi:hypothetical protein
MIGHSDVTIEADELIVDLFAGGGGASTGIERANFTQPIKARRAA